MTEDRYGDRLREILSAEAERVVPKGDGLMNIQARTAERNRRWWTAPAAALATAALVVAGIFVGMNLADDDDSAGIGDPGPSAPASADPNPSPSPSGAPVTTVTVPVYYLKDDGRGLRLYREFHRAPARGGNIETAIEEMLHAPAQDPDYTSLWPKATQLLGVTVSGDVASVDLSAEAKQQSQSGAEGEALSVQQLVYTVTATQPTVKTVRLLVDGVQVSDLWGHGAVPKQPIARAPAVDVQAFVWLLAPTQDATVSSPVKLSGVGCVFEANVSIEVLKDGKVVQRTFAMTDGGCPRFGPWEKTLDLEPGDYLVRAFESSAKDGSPQYVDDKAIHVE